MFPESLSSYEDILKVRERKKLSLNRSKKRPTIIYSEGSSISEEEENWIPRLENKLAKVHIASSIAVSSSSSSH